MGDEPPISTPTRRNVRAYASVEAVEQYTRRAREKGLFPAEETVLGTYFTPPTGTVLDLGCGAGRTTRELAARGFDVVGVDASERMVRAAEEAFPHLDVRVGDAADLRFDDDAFDYVLFSHSGIDYLHPECDRLAALREIRRVLTPGGLFAFSTNNWWYALPAALVDRAHLRNMFLGNGNARRLGSRYRVDGREYDMLTYQTSPPHQRAQLRECGFEFLAYVGKRDSPLRYLERQPYYVARKPLDRS